jgi:hypothetical protein
VKPQIRDYPGNPRSIRPDAGIKAKSGNHDNLLVFHGNI